MVNDPAPPNDRFKATTAFVTRQRCLAKKGLAFHLKESMCVGTKWFTSPAQRL